MKQLNLKPHKLVSLEYFGAGGWSAFQYGGLTSKATPHLLKPDTLKYTEYNKAWRGAAWCNVGGNLATIDAAPLVDWVRGWERDRAPGWPFRYCPKCWRNFHKAAGLPIPEQAPKYDPLAEQFDILPNREVLNLETGERWMPAIVLRRKGREEPVAYKSRKSLKADGTPRRYGGYYTMQATIGNPRARTMHGHALAHIDNPWVWYDADLDSAASEIRTEIAMHERRLNEARQHLAELMEEDDGG